uniref:Uncharacterized protein n=1 Tax=Spongospora subterranea TaxID=70186 RepID=A0A0H5QGT2_9EUKA|eukprot:CRZ01185.1 hypothetical protein [Spongospora subterranea]
MSKGLERLLPQITTVDDLNNNHFRIQSPGLTIKEVRQRDVILVIALDKNHSATGILYIDDGDTLGTVIAGKFTRIEYSVTSIGNVTSNSLEYDLMFVADVVNNGYDASIMISDLRIFPVCNGSLIIEAGFDFPLNIMHSLNVSLSCRRQIKMIEDLPSSIKI